jgi:hypothetical protein
VAGNVRVIYAAHPEQGAVAVDEATGRQGVIMAREVQRDRWSHRVLNESILLRPIGGGREFAVAREDLRLLRARP